MADHTAQSAPGLDVSTKPRPLQPSQVALPEAFPPGHPCGATLPHPATPVQHQPKSRCAALRLAAGRREWRENAVYTSYGIEARLYLSWERRSG